MNNVNLQFITALIIISIGYLSKRIGLVTEKEGGILVKVILNITLPALILNTFTNIEIKLTLGLLTLICIGFTIVLVLIAVLVFRKEKPESKGLMIVSTIGFNIGLFAYPLVEGIWGKEGLTHIAMFDMGNTPFVIFGLCYVLACIYSPLHTSIKIRHILKKLATLMPLWSFFIALILNVVGFKFPPIPGLAIKNLAETNGGLVFILLGIYLNFKLEKHYWKRLLKVLLIRYTAGLVIGLILYFMLPYSPIFRAIVLVALIMPVGMATIPYSIELGYDKKLSGALVNFSNILSFIIIWILSNILFKP